jgi:UDP-glucose 4-epimerase
MRVLVTGASGFVGAHVVRALLADGLEPVVVLRRATTPWRLADVDGRVDRIVGDLATVETWAPRLVAAAPDVVLHLAWEGVANTQRNAPFQLGSNLTGTLALVEAAARAGATTWIGLGSQAEYGPLRGRIDETHPTRPTSLYGVAKLAAGLASAVRCRELGVRHAWLRLFATYGPLDDGPWLIPSLIRGLLAGETPALTAGTQRWDWLEVSDVAAALVACARSPDVSGVYNLGSGEARTIRSAAETIRDLVAPGVRLAFGAVPMRSDQTTHLEADASRLRRDTGWRPQVRFADGIARTVEWYREHGARVVH